MLKHRKSGLAIDRREAKLIRQPSDTDTQGRHIALKTGGHPRERLRTGLDGDVSRQGSGPGGKPSLANSGQLSLRKTVGLTDRLDDGIQ